MGLVNHKYNILFCYRNNMNPEKRGVQKVADLLVKFFISNGNKVYYLNSEKGLTNISFKGFANSEPYYQEASSICMTSDYEGFGMVLIEVMQYGVVPVTFNNWASLKDIIIDNETGLFVPSGDIDNYIFKLIEIIRNEKLRNAIASNAVKQVQKFDINRIGEQWLNLFDSLHNKN